MKRVLILIAVIVFAILIIGLGTFIVTKNQDKSFNISNIYPKNYSTNIPIDSKITFEFNQNLSPNDLDNIVSIQPQVEFQKIFQNNSIIIIPKNVLLNNQQYIIKLSHIKSNQNETLSDQTILFITSPISKEKQAFLDGLPYITDKYRIDYSTVNNTFTITILTNPYEDSKQAALDFLESKGIDTSREKIQFSELRFLRGSGAPPG